MEHALEAIFDGGLETDEPTTVGDQGAQVAHVLRWHSDFG